MLRRPRVQVQVPAQGTLQVCALLRDTDFANVSWKWTYVTPPLILQVRPFQLPVCCDVRPDPGRVPLRPLLPHPRLRRLPQHLRRRLPPLHEQDSQVPIHFSTEWVAPLSYQFEMIHGLSASWLQNAGRPYRVTHLLADLGWVDSDF